MRILDEASATPVLRAVSVPEDPVTLPDDAAFAAHMARRRYGTFTLTDVSETAAVQCVWWDYTAGVPGVCVCVCVCVCV